MIAAQRNATDGAERLLWVNGGKTRNEYTFSGLAQIADIIGSAGSPGLPETVVR